MSSEDPGWICVFLEYILKPCEYFYECDKRSINHFLCPVVSQFLHCVARNLHVNYFVKGTYGIKKSVAF